MHSCPAHALLQMLGAEQGTWALACQCRVRKREEGRITRQNPACRTNTAMCPCTPEQLQVFLPKILQEVYSFILSLRPLLLRPQIILCWKIFHVANFRKGLHCKIRIIKKQKKAHNKLFKENNLSTFTIVPFSPSEWFAFPPHLPHYYCLYFFQLTPFSP